MTLYRVTPVENFSTSIIPHPLTRRPPGNVPYLIDNLWEWLRPDDRFPCRRMSAFASPSPDLALEGASVNESRRNDFIVTTVSFTGKAAIAQISQKDARFHPDIKKLTSVVLGFCGMGWADEPASKRIGIAPLFIPAVSKEEIDELFSVIVNGENLAEIIRSTSIFWQDAKLLTPNSEKLAYPDGEIFFEAFDGYRLSQVN